MTARDIIEVAEADGYRLRLRGDRIKITGPCPPSETLLANLRRRRDEIRRELRAREISEHLARAWEAEKARHATWIAQLDARMLSHLARSLPPAVRRDALGDYELLDALAPEYGRVIDDADAAARVARDRGNRAALEAAIARWHDAWERARSAFVDALRESAA